MVACMTTPAAAQDGPSASDVVTATQDAVRSATDLGLTRETATADTVQVAGGVVASSLSGGVATTILVSTDPRTPALAVTSDGSAMGIGVPENAAAGQGVVTGDAVVFENKQEGTATTVQPLADGSIRTSVKIDGADAPHDFRFSLTLPQGTSPVLQSDGSVLISSSTETDDEASAVDGASSIIDPAWAVDANGDPVATSYSLEGSTLVQHVEFTGDTAFPVVADPFWSTAWHVTKCVAAITVAVASVALPIAKLAKLRAFVRAVGGVSTAARLLVGATTTAEKLRVIGGAIGAGAADVLGISAIIDNC